MDYLISGPLFQHTGTNLLCLPQVKTHTSPTLCFLFSFSFFLSILLIDWLPDLAGRIADDPPADSTEAAAAAHEDPSAGGALALRQYLLPHDRPPRDHSAQREHLQGAALAHGDAAGYHTGSQSSHPHSTPHKT